LSIIALLSSNVLAADKGFDLKNADTNDRMTYHRAIDAAVWAMPLMNFKFYRDSLADNGVGPNDVGYNSKLQDWRFQTETPLLPPGPVLWTEAGIVRRQVPAQQHRADEII
jgi:hypothetical protein